MLGGILAESKDERFRLIDNIYSNIQQLYVHSSDWDTKGESQAALFYFFPIEVILLNFKFHKPEQEKNWKEINNSLCNFSSF